MAKAPNFLCNNFSKSADSEQILARQIILDSLERIRYCNKNS